MSVDTSGSGDEAAATKLYCICRRPYEGEFMIVCDTCAEWYHGTCIGVSPEDAEQMDVYICAKCLKSNKKSKGKKAEKIKKKEGDPTESSSSASKPKSSKSSALSKGKSASGPTIIDFETILLNRQFSPASECLVTLETGQGFTPLYMENVGFSRPHCIRQSSTLDMRMPNINFSVGDVASLVGEKQTVEVIDVHTQQQESKPWQLSKWATYYQTPKEQRTRVLNVISLEFTGTPLAQLIQSPKIVRDIDWIDLVWPREKRDLRPKVQLYCLMGTAGSYTDFHIDFGGSSVWYHLLKGRKIFYFIEPTPQNLSLYEKWTGSPKQSKTFFADSVSKCYQVVVNQGETLFIPSGWIHAVYTPIDSLVFGGNFIHYYAMEMQMRIYELERRSSISKKFSFPNYEAITWYAAEKLLNLLNYKNTIPLWMVTGLGSLVEGLTTWLSRKKSAEKFPSEIRDAQALVTLLKDWYQKGCTILSQNLSSQQMYPQLHHQHTIKLPGVMSNGASMGMSGSSMGPAGSGYDSSGSRSNNNILTLSHNPLSQQNEASKLNQMLVNDQRFTQQPLVSGTKVTLPNLGGYTGKTAESHISQNQHPSATLKLSLSQHQHPQSSLQQQQQQQQQQQHVKLKLRATPGQDPLSSSSAWDSQDEAVDEYTAAAALAGLATTMAATEQEKMTKIKLKPANKAGINIHLKSTNASNNNGSSTTVLNNDIINNNGINKHSVQPLGRELRKEVESEADASVKKNRTIRVQRRADEIATLSSLTGDEKPERAKRLKALKELESDSDADSPRYSSSEYEEDFHDGNEEEEGEEAEVEEQDDDDDEYNANGGGNKKKNMRAIKQVRQSKASASKSPGAAKAKGSTLPGRPSSENRSPSSASTPRGQNISASSSTTSTAPAPTTSAKDTPTFSLFESTPIVAKSTPVLFSPEANKSLLFTPKSSKPSSAKKKPSILDKLRKDIKAGKL